MYGYLNIFSCRSVLYQLKAFGNSFSMNPIQLPPKACILSVATSETHFVVVNNGKLLWSDTCFTCLKFNSCTSEISVDTGNKETRVILAIKLTHLIKRYSRQL